ncbi:MAG: hypothetical protein F6K31_26405 [Symploca sp. SIO2G7]|nr:hypothetical protein [Symploca sp. SIO2G7]
MMLKLRVFTGTTLALLLSAGSGYSALAIENTQTTTQQPTNTQLAHAGDNVTISGIVTDIDDDVVTVRTIDGDTKRLLIPEDEQEELGIEVGDAVSGTAHDHDDDDVIPVSFVTRREVKPVRIELTERTRETRITRPAPTSRPAPAPVSRPAPRPAPAQTSPVPGLW